jgi:hypothetical protein
LPDAQRDRDPNFDHYPERPVADLPGSHATVITVDGD